MAKIYTKKTEADQRLPVMGGCSVCIRSHARLNRLEIVMSEQLENTKEIDTDGLSAGNALRHKLFNIITPVLLGCDRVDDAATRLMIKGCCSQMVKSLEQLIREYELDELRVDSATSEGKGA